MAAKRLKRILAAPFIFVAAVLILLEDWLWDDLARLAALIGRLPVFHQLEALVVRLPAPAALFLFVIPSLLLIPVKLAALYLIAHGHTLTGVATIVGAKIAGTALVARLFTLTKAKLLTIRWFAWVYERIVAFKKRIYSGIKSSAVYQHMHRWTTRLRDGFRVWRGKQRHWLSRRWKAALKLFRSRRKAGTG